MTGPGPAADGRAGDPAAQAPKRKWDTLESGVSRQTNHSGTPEPQGFDRGRGRSFGILTGIETDARDHPSSEGLRRTPRGQHRVGLRHVDIPQVGRWAAASQHGVDVRDRYLRSMTNIIRSVSSRGYAAASSTRSQEVIQVTTHIDVCKSRFWCKMKLANFHEEQTNQLDDQ